MRPVGRMGKSDPGQRGMKGIGVDVVSVTRIDRALGRTRGFAEAVFTSFERAECEGRPMRARARRYASRFAAKEAFLKALGLGVFGPVALADVEVRPGGGGRAGLWLGPTAARALAQTGGATPLLSLSHLEDLALALVVVP